MFKIEGSSIDSSNKRERRRKRKEVGASNYRLVRRKAIRKTGKEKSRVGLDGDVNSINTTRVRQKRVELKSRL